MVQAIIDAISSVPAAAAYAIIALLVFGEAALFVGFVFPGETAVLIGGFLASRGHLDVVVLVALVVVCAILGDTVGYEVGKYVGPKVLRLGILEKRRGRIERAQDMLRRRGGPAVFLGRWTAFFRAVMPGIAGLSGMRYRVFVLWNALGGLVWGTTFCLVGYFAGASYATVASSIGKGAAVVIAVAVVAALAIWQVRRHRQESAEDDEL